ncbi:MAG: hypothetical protein ACE5KT_07350 [Methanosarcinales archaeon]
MLNTLLLDLVFIEVFVLTEKEKGYISYRALEFCKGSEIIYNPNLHKRIKF